MSNKDIMIRIAKRFSGNKGVDWENVSERNLLLLIEDSIEGLDFK